MASPNTTYDDVGALAIANRSKELHDNVSGNVAFLDKMTKKGKNRYFSGGSSITREIAYQETGNFLRYSGFQALNTSIQQTMTRADYAIKQTAVAVPVSGLEEMQTGSPEGFKSMLAARMEVAEMTMRNNMSADLYSAGTASGGLQIGGLQSIASDAGTGTVGGIISGSNSFWLSSYYDFSDNSLTPGSSTIRQAMLALWLKVVRGRDKPDVGVADNIYWQYYHDSLTPHLIINGNKTADGAFAEIDFMGVPIMLDGGMGGDAPASHLYLLNTDYLEFVTHESRDFAPLNPKRFASNQDASVQYIAWAGNLVCSNRSLQGALVA